jgi:hypothetical protein
MAQHLIRHHSSRTLNVHPFLGHKLKPPPWPLSDSATCDTYIEHSVFGSEQYPKKEHEDAQGRHFKVTASLTLLHERRDVHLAGSSTEATL